MKLLLDENLPNKLRLRITGHEVVTAAYAGLRGVSNGGLLERAASDGFDALITGDTGMAQQHNVQTLPIAIVVLHAPTNDLSDLIGLVPNLLRALNHLVPKSIAHVHGGSA